MSELMENVTRIKVFGVGGGGSNAVNNIEKRDVNNLTYYVANTDIQALRISKVENQILLGQKETKGLGCGGNPAVGAKAAMEAKPLIQEAVKDADLVIVTAGMGGGTGTGAAPIIAQCAKEVGALTVAVVTKPFAFEGKRRMTQAIEGIEKLREAVDCIIVVPNHKLYTILGDVPMKDAFKQADNVLGQTITTIIDLIGYPALINLDFADVKSVMAGKGDAIIGVSSQDGKDTRQSIIDVAKLAAAQAISCPLLESTIEGKTSAIVNITGGYSLTAKAAEAAVETIKEAAGTEIDIIFGIALNENLDDTIIVSVIATGEKNDDSPVEVEKPKEKVETAFRQPQARVVRQPSGVEVAKAAEKNNYPQFFTSRDRW